MDRPTRYGPVPFPGSRLPAAAFRRPRSRPPHRPRGPLAPLARRRSTVWTSTAPYAAPGPRRRALRASPGQYRDPCSPSALEFVPEAASDLVGPRVHPRLDESAGCRFGPVETSRGLSLLTKRLRRAILWSSARDAAVPHGQRKPGLAARVSDTVHACCAVFCHGRAGNVSSALPSGSELGFHKARESDSTAVGLSATLLVCAAFYRMSTFRSRPVTPSTGVGLVEFSGSVPDRAPVARSESEPSEGPRHLGHRRPARRER